MYSCHLFLISSDSVRSILFLSFTTWRAAIHGVAKSQTQLSDWTELNWTEAHLCMKCSLGISNFLEEISSLSHSIVCLYFFGLITEEGFLISPCCSLELCIQMGIPFLFCFAFHFSSFHSYFQGLLRQPFCFFAFLFLGDGLDSCLLYNVTNFRP